MEQGKGRHFSGGNEVFWTGDFGGEKAVGCFARRSSESCRRAEEEEGPSWKWELETFSYLWEES